MPDLTRRQCSVARMRGNRRGCAARGPSSRTVYRMASPRGRAGRCARSNPPQRRTAGTSALRARTYEFTYRTNENRAACAWRPEVEPVRCGAVEQRPCVAGSIRHAPRLHARTSSHSTSTSVLPCVLRRPRPARRRQLAQHLLPPASSHASSVAAPAVSPIVRPESHHPRRGTRLSSRVRTRGEARDVNTYHSDNVMSQ
jgi:hypothetical protein